MSGSDTPDGWSIAPLSDLVALDAPICYGIVQPGPSVRDGVPMIAIRDLLNLIPSKLHRSAASIEASYRRSRVAPGDVLISVKGTTGRIGIVPDGLTANISRDVARLRFCRDQEPGYWFQLLRSERAQRTLEQARVGTTRQELSINTLKTLEFEFPSAPEQAAIAEKLADADRLIEALQALVAKKRDIRQGMVQEVLAGRTRLPGFSSPWKTTKLSLLGQFVRGRGIKREDVRTVGVPCIRYGELYTTFVDYTDTVVSFVSPAVAAAALPIRSNDILFAGSGETKEEIGMCVAYVGDKPAVAGGDIIVLRGNGYDAVYLALLLNTPEFAVQKARAGQGDAVVHINWRALSDLTVTIPELAEQRSIARVVRDVDDEIEALERRLESARAVKTGMMQELLTGRTRLPVEVVS